MVHTHTHAYAHITRTRLHKLSLFFFFTLSLSLSFFLSILFLFTMLCSSTFCCIIGSFCSLFHPFTFIACDQNNGQDTHKYFSRCTCLVCYLFPSCYCYSSTSCLPSLPLPVILLFPFLSSSLPVPILLPVFFLLIG